MAQVDRGRVLRARQERAHAVSSTIARINEDLTEIPHALAALEPVLTALSRETVNRHGRRPMAGDLLVARDLRRTVLAAVGHQFAMSLLPQTIGVLSGAIMVPVVGSPQVDGARGRTFAGGRATLVATLCACFGRARQHMYQQWSDSERLVVTAELRRLALTVRRHARGAHQEEFGDRWTDQAARHEPYRVLPGDGRPHRSRTLTFLAEHLSADLDVSLRGSELGQAEHLTVGLADLDRALAAAGCRGSARRAVVLEHLPVLSRLAALRDEVADRIVFAVPHPPLYQVRSDGDGDRFAISALRSPLNAQAHQRPGRCPAVEVVTPARQEFVSLGESFRRVLGDLTGDRCPGHLHAGVSAADVSSALAVGVMDQLTRLGAVRLNQ